MSLIFSAWTVIVLILFVGIVIWAWSGKRKAEFNEAAMIPFNEDEEEITKNQEENPDA